MGFPFAWIAQHFQNQFQLFPGQRMAATFTVKPSVNYSPTLVNKLPNSPLVVGDMAG
jgi:hypothetical protein